jgi:acetyltransferase-like isoleucine patch superfamily enzyme
VQRNADSVHDGMGVNSIISENIRIRLPDDFKVGDYSIVDDFCYFSTRVSIGRFCHIANGVSVGGGKEQTFVMADYSSVSAGARIWCASDDFTCDMAAIAPAGISIPKKMITGNVIMEELTIVGSNSVVMPANTIPEGVAIGALSFVPPEYEFEPWTIYAGTPIRPIKKRDRSSVLKQKQSLEQQLAEISSAQ